MTEARLRAKLKTGFDKIAAKTGAVREFPLITETSGDYDTTDASFGTGSEVQDSIRGVLSDISETDYVDGIDLSALDKKLLTLENEGKVTRGQFIEDGDEKYEVLHVKRDPVKATETSYLRIDRRVQA